MKSSPVQPLAASQTHDVQVFDIIDQTMTGTGKICTSLTSESSKKKVKRATTTYSFMRTSCVVPGEFSYSAPIITHNVSCQVLVLSS